MNLKEAKGIMAKKLNWAEMDKSNTLFEKLRGVRRVQPNREPVATDD